MKKRAFAFLAFAIISSISLGFTYINQQEDLKTVTTNAVTVSDLPADYVSTSEGLVIENNSKYLASWN